MADPDVLIVSSGAVTGPKAHGSVRGASAIGTVQGIPSVVLPSGEPVPLLLLLWLAQIEEVGE